MAPGLDFRDMVSLRLEIVGILIIAAASWMSGIPAVLDVFFIDAWRCLDIWISDSVRFAIRLCKELSVMLAGMTTHG
jgi:hypothetical protein